MIQFKGMRAERNVSGGGEREKLPAGGYVARITKTYIKKQSWADQLVIEFDICEGDYIGFFQRDADNNTFEPGKWRGVYRLNIPKGDEFSDRDLADQKKFNNLIYALEDSNRGYRFDGDELLMRGKVIGVIFGNKQWEYNGNTGWSTQCFGVDSAANIREGSYVMPKDRPLRKKKAKSVDDLASSFPETVTFSDPTQTQVSPTPTFATFDDGDGTLPF
jgi:hypothetical protein